MLTCVNPCTVYFFFNINTEQVIKCQRWPLELGAFKLQVAVAVLFA